jgi:uncharacterized FAD-dependent dehydrogenase
LCGWGGAGAFSDGKLTLTPDVGGHLVDYMPRKKVEELIKYADDMYLELSEEQQKSIAPALFILADNDLI